MTGLTSINELFQKAGFNPNPAQLSAIEHVDGPLWLVAGPGSGKTRVLLWRTLNLIVFHGVSPEAIFLSTFTEKAALQLKQGLFTNKDGSTGVLYLATSDLQLDYGRIMAIYQKRWSVEVFHKSIKSNTGLARSPTHSVRTQSNHFFASIYAFLKLELLKLKYQLNHFALRSKLYIKALQASFAELQQLTA